MTKGIHRGGFTQTSRNSLLFGSWRWGKKYAKILGYNYNTSEWFQQSYKILNKDYKILKKTEAKSEDEGFFRKILKKIK